MRKIFTFLFAALMSVGMFATTVVTITDSDFPASGSSLTKDGVTVSAYAIDGKEGNISGPGSFSTTLGNFTKIEVSAASISVSGEDWSGDYASKTWTGNASSVEFTGTINGYGMGTTLKFTIEPASTPEPELELDKTVGYVAFPTENRPASIELAGVNRDFTWPMAALQAAPWYITDYTFDNYLYTAVSDTIKFRDAANNAIVLCEFIPANGGQEGRWQQYYLKMADYEMALEKGTMVRLIEELDLTDASNYAWMENAPEPLPTGIEHIVLTEKAQKVIMDGVIYIVRDGKLFNLTGAQVR